MNATFSPGSDGRLFVVATTPLLGTALGWLVGMHGDGVKVLGVFGQVGVPAAAIVVNADHRDQRVGKQLPHLS
eukprot:scaffold52910_cov55-Phaeocystis_antarctica.AAC.2